MARKKRRPDNVQQEPLPTVTKVAPPDSGAASAGQSGDLQGLPNMEESDSESVRELVEEGQFFEASVVSGIENAPPADAGPVKVHKRPEDDLPPEYADRVPDEPKE